MHESRLDAFDLLFPRFSIKHRFPVLIRICIKTHLDLRLRIFVLRQHRQFVRRKPAALHRLDIFCKFSLHNLAQKKHLADSIGKEPLIMAPHIVKRYHTHRDYRQAGL